MTEPSIDARIQSGGGWIQTFTGKAFPVLDPRPDDVVIDDIAHALSMLCRFTGHVRTFYSVAQHCVLVAEVVRRFQPENRPLHLAALLHDAAEAYIQDLPRPIKRLNGIRAFYKPVEEVVEEAIRARFFVPTAVWGSPAIKVADEMLLRTECRDLMGPLHPAWSRELHPDHGTTMPERIVPWSPQEAEERFLARFDELTA